MSDRSSATTTRAGFHVTIMAEVDPFACAVSELADRGHVVQTWQGPYHGWATFTPGQPRRDDRGVTHNRPPRPSSCGGNWRVVKAAGPSQGDSYRIWYNADEIPADERAAFADNAAAMMNGTVSAYGLTVEIRATPGGSVLAESALFGFWIEYRPDGATLIQEADGAGMIDEAIHKARRNAAAAVTRLRAEADTIAAAMRRDADAIAAVCAGV
jgi:hypothetical protein